MSDDFAKRMAEIKGIVADKTRQFKQGTAQVLANEMISGGKYSPGTPIDVGFHRSHWDASSEGIPAGGESTGQAAAEARVTEAITGWESDVLYLTNNGPAIRRLEFAGWSKQAPDGFVRLAANAIQPIADEVAATIAGR